MNPSENFTAIKRLFALALLSGCATAFATQTVGTVTDLSGPLFVRTESGAIRILGQHSSIRPGDTLVSEQDTYARITFIDKSEITLRQNTQIRIEKFSFNEAPQESDRASIRLLQGGLHVTSGLLGKRSKDRFLLNTATSTIDMQNATLFVEYIPDQTRLVAYRAVGMAALRLADILTAGIPRDVRQSLLPVHRLQSLVLAQVPPNTQNPGGLAAGLYVHVIDGIINLSNRGGSQNFAAGQFGYTSSFIKPPVVVPNNPGIQFTPPPAFSSSTTQQNGTGNNNKSSSVDCEVR